jgi:hypothetical protein
MRDYDLITDELRDSWENGNRTDVIASVTYIEPGERAPGAHIALLTSMLVSKLDERQRAVFARLLANQIG